MSSPACCRSASGSTSALSEHLAHLTAAGYVTQHRGVRDSRSRLWLAPTPEGTRAFAEHVQALQQIITSDASCPGQAAHEQVRER